MNQKKKRDLIKPAEKKEALFEIYKYHIDIAKKKLHIICF